jgi:hypothetical protein
MLPPGFTADAAPAPEQAWGRTRLPGAQSVVRLRVGGCACQFRLPRGEANEDERYLRRRYAELGLSRERIIAALERHRRGAAPAREPATLRAALAGFVAEHARNAGPTLYGLGFGADVPDAMAAIGRRLMTSAAGVRAAADTWLPEDCLVEVGR